MDLRNYLNTKISPGFYDYFHVPDRIQDNDKIIITLESGHIEEVINKMPLCGESGKNFSELFFEKNEPVGKLHKVEVSEFGFLESCSVPIDENTYKNFINQGIGPLNTNDLQKLSRITNIKRQYDQMVPHGKYNEFKEWLSAELVGSKLYEDYQNRLNTIWNKHKKFVICGFIAQAFFEHYLGISGKEGYESFYRPRQYVSHNTNKIIYVNHPRNWSNLGFSGKAKIKSAIMS